MNGEHMKELLEEGVVYDLGFLQQMKQWEPGLKPGRDYNAITVEQLPDGGWVVHLTVWRGHWPEGQQGRTANCSFSRSELLGLGVAKLLDGVRAKVMQAWERLKALKPVEVPT